MDREPIWTESRKLFRDATNRADLLAWVCEEDGYCTYLSLGWHRVTGSADGHGYNWLNDIHPDDRPRTMDVFWQANTNKSQYIVDYRLKLACGAYAEATARGMPQFDSAGVYQGIVGFTEMEIEKRRFRSKSSHPPLTDREREILALFAKGYTAETAGTLLGIGTQTVANHARSALAKLQALNRTHAVVLAMSLNEITVPGVS